MTARAIPPARDPQRGSAMLVTLLVIISLLAGAAVLASMQLASNRSADVTRSGLRALYCAEAGLDAARPIVAANYNTWSTYLGQNTEPPWLNKNGAWSPTTPPSSLCTCTPDSTCTGCAPGINHDIDGDGLPDFYITLVNNVDSGPPVPIPNNIDHDLQIFVVSTCINPNYPDTQKQVEELVYMSGGGTCYKSQLGNCQNNGNFN